MTTPAYSLDKISFFYGTRRVLYVDSLNIPSGVVTAILGPNGSGKTTLLQLLSFVEQPSGGSLSLFGQPACRSNRLSFRRRIGYLMQKPYLFDMDVFENVAWALKLRGMDTKTVKAVCEEALSIVDLSGFDKRHARSLSGGEAQRVALARALAINPDIFLFDEPASHLDTKSQSLINDIMINLAQSKDKTVLIITHDYSDIARFVPNFIELEAGSLVNSTIDS